VKEGPAVGKFDVKTGVAPPLETLTFCVAVLHIIAMYRDPPIGTD